MIISARIHRFKFSGGKGSCLTIGWAEALYMDHLSHTKGQRDEVEGRTFVAPCHDIIRADGGARGGLNRYGGVPGVLSSCLSKHRTSP
jgi:hypothetical protein